VCEPGLESLLGEHLRRLLGSAAGLADLQALPLEPFGHPREPLGDARDVRRLAWHRDAEYALARTPRDQRPAGKAGNRGANGRHVARARVPGPLRALSAMESTVLPTAPTFLPTAPTFSPMPSGFEAGRFGREDLAGLEVERAREEPEARFAELLLLRDAERELVVFRGLAVVGMGPLLFS
jgi:hypothetical protein